MAVDPNTASLIANEVLVCFYGLLLAGAFVALFGPWHAKTPTIRWFCISLSINCVCRMVFFGVPAEAWGSGIDPSDVERFSPEFWKLFIQFAFYVIGDFASETEYIFILRLWHKAQCILTDTYPRWPPILLNSSLVLMGSWAGAMVIMYMTLPFHEVLVVASAAKLAICVAIFAAFMYYLAALRNIMKTAAMRPSCYTMCCQTIRNDALLNDMREYNTWRARQKLARITRVCLLYSVCSLFHACVMAIQLRAAVSNFQQPRFGPNFWWALVDINYFVTEIVSASLLLWIVSKPCKGRRRTKTAYAALDTEEHDGS